MLLLLFHFQAPIFATVFTWNAASATATNWNANTNWIVNSGNPQATSDMAVFDANAVNPTLNVDRSVSNLLFTANAPALTLNGSAWLTVEPDSSATLGILNQSPNTETINFNISNQITSIVIATTAGDLVLNGAINYKTVLSVGGSGVVKINGPVSGTGIFQKSAGSSGAGNTGTLILAGDNTGFTGSFRFAAGTVILDSSNALAGISSSILTLATGNAATLLIGTGGLTNSTDWNLNSKHTGVITMGGTNSSGTTTYTGAINLFTNTGASHDLIVTASSGGTTKFAGTITEGNTAGNITKNNAGTVIFAVSNNFTGTTTVSEGVINIQDKSALGGTTLGATSGTIVNSGAALQIQGNIAVGNEVLILNGSGISSDGALRNISGNNSWAGVISNASDATISSDSGTLTLSGGITNGGNQLTTSGAGNITISGIMSGSGGMVQNSSGTVTLSGANDFTGAYTNVQGTTIANNATALGTGTKNITVAGGTLLFNLGVTNSNANVTLSGGAIQQSDMNISLGALTLAANSSISLTKDGTDGSFRFASATNTGANTLTITGWSGDQSGGDGDLIFFTTTTGITASFLNNVSFAGYYGGAAINTATGELVPITPEPGTLLGALALLSTLVRQFLLRTKSEGHSV